MSEHAALPPRPRTPVLGKLAAAVAVVVVLVAGIFFFGRLADTDTVAMFLTGIWFGVVLAGGFIFSRARTDLRLPMGVAYAAIAIAAGIVLGLPLLGDDEVNEKVVTATAAPAGGGNGQRGEGNARPAGNVLVASGSFASIAHSGEGKASVIELPSGERKLTLTEFETDNGPDLRLYVSTGDPAGGGELGDFEDLGGLKGNVGNQQYDLPEGLDLDKYSTVVVWCRAFSVAFTSAGLS